MVRLLLLGDVYYSEPICDIVHGIGGGLYSGYLWRCKTPDEKAKGL